MFPRPSIDSYTKPMSLPHPTVYPCLSRKGQTFPVECVLANASNLTWRYLENLGLKSIIRAKPFRLGRRIALQQFSFKSFDESTSCIETGGSLLSPFLNLGDGFATSQTHMWSPRPSLSPSSKRFQKKWIAHWETARCCRRFTTSGCGRFSELAIVQTQLLRLQNLWGVICATSPSRTCFSITTSSSLHKAVPIRALNCTAE